MPSYEWRAASEDFTSTRRYGRLSLEKGLVAPVKKATEKIRVPAAFFSGSGLQSVHVLNV